MIDVASPSFLLKISLMKNSQFLQTGQKWWFLWWKDQDVRFSKWARWKILRLLPLQFSRYLKITPQEEGQGLYRICIHLSTRNFDCLTLMQMFPMINLKLVNPPHMWLQTTLRKIMIMKKSMAYFTLIPLEKT